MASAGAGRMISHYTCSNEVLTHSKLEVFGIIVSRELGYKLTYEMSTKLGNKLKMTIKGYTLTS